MIPNRSSALRKGGISTSTILPWILPIMIEDEVLANAFWMIAIMIRPGARNSRKGTSPMVRPPRPSATENTRRNIITVTSGAATVCSGTFRKRRTSFR